MTLASEYTRRSLQIQQQLARNVSKNLNTIVYVFDAANYFTDATTIVIDGIRCLQKEENYAVLSETAQDVFTEPNQYNQFSNQKLQKSEIGLYIDSDSDEQNEFEIEEELSKLKASSSSGSDSGSDSDSASISEVD